MSNNDEDKDPWDFDSYVIRYSSFADKWKVNFLSPTVMAHAGFTYTGISDRVVCLYCDIEIDTWEPEEDPLQEHREKSPYCAYFRSVPGSDVCGNNEPSNPFMFKIKKTLLQYLHSIGMVQIVTLAAYREMSMIEVRLQTFNKCELKMKQDFYNYAEAGFFYIGDGADDHMICFCCNQGLMNWDEDDDPWIEHARWSPKCCFVILSKGREFVQKASGNEPEIIEISQLELTEVIDQQNKSASGVIMKVNAENKVLEEQKIDVSRILAKIDLKESDKKENPDVLHDSMMCKICYRQEMNIAFLPCRHILACIECALTLDTCPLCRKPFTMVIKVFIKTSKEKDEKLKDIATNTSQDPTNTSQDLMEPSNPMLCKVCNKREMQILFAFCRHVYTCAQCADVINKCPECSEKIHATMQVYL